MVFHYPLLNALREEYAGDLEILGFPSNLFLLQEPGSNSEILPLLEHVRPGGGYVPSFPMFEKLDVNGENEHAMYTQLKVRKAWTLSMQAKLRRDPNVICDTGIETPPLRHTVFCTTPKLPIPTIQAHH